VPVQRGASHDVARAYVAVTGDNHVAAVDLRTFQVVGKIETGQGPDGMAWVRQQ
jgi:DNA-binding beta-propeller fold protein YncE